jgi:hypothetical protein
VFGDDAVVGAWGGLAGVDVVEELLQAAVVDVVLHLFAGESADAEPLLRGEGQRVELADGEALFGEGAPVSAGEVSGPGLVVFGELGGHVMDEPAVMLDGIDLTGGGAVVRVAVVGEGMPAGGDPLAEGGQVIGRQAEGEEVVVGGAVLLDFKPNGSSQCSNISAAFDGGVI